MKLLRKLARVYGEGGVSGITSAVRRRFKEPVKEPEPRIPAMEWTEYMTWLSFANPGMLDRGNVDCFDWAIRHRPSDDPIVEIGSFCGLSTNMLTYVKHRHGARNRLITCDRWIFEGSDNALMLGDGQVSHADYSAFVKESYIRNIGLFSGTDLPYTVELLSDEFFAAWSGHERRQDVLGRQVELGGPISFCYIDGNHSYEFARRDFDNADRFVQARGFILLDDSADTSEYESRVVAVEALATRRYRLVTKAPNYFIQKL